MLCDCPGLVFPSFMKSTGEMLCSGILPINQMRDYAEPANIIASRVPMHLLDAAYGMKIVRNLDFKDDPDRPATSSEVLEAYCKLKGYITNGTGRWDEFRACKELLRDFNDGRILAVVPPSMAMIDSKRWLAETEKTMMRNERVAERLLSHRPDELTPSVRKVGIKNDESEEFESGEMVFNFVPSNASTKNNTIASDHTVEEDRYEIVDDSDDDLSEGHSVANSRSMQSDQRVTREHKRMKHWGKKNKKLRNKNPYGDDNGAISYVAYSTNRQYKPQTANAILASDKSVLSGVASTSSAYGGLSKRQANRQQVDTLFTRAVLPHHQQK